MSTLSKVRYCFCFSSDVWTVWTAHQFSSVITCMRQELPVAGKGQRSKSWSHTRSLPIYNTTRDTQVPLRGSTLSREGHILPRYTRQPDPTLSLCYPLLPAATRYIVARATHFLFTDDLNFLYMWLDTRQWNEAVRFILKNLNLFWKDCSVILLHRKRKEYLSGHTCDTRTTYPVYFPLWWQHLSPAMSTVKREWILVLWRLMLPYYYFLFFVVFWGGELFNC